MKKYARIFSVALFLLCFSSSAFAWTPPGGWDSFRKASKIVMAAPGPIGSTTPSTGAFTSLTASSLAAFTTAAESWIGPSSTTGVYFKGGNVGIGTTAPATGNKLEVNGFAASFTGILTQAATANLAASNMMGQSHIVTGNYVLSLPTAVVGYNSCFMATTAAVFSLDMVTVTDAFYLNQTALTAGNKVTSDGTIRSEICVECKVAGFYETYIRKGIYIDGGA